MTWQGAIVDVLLGAAPVTALVGQRLTPKQLDQDSALPALVYQVIDGRREHGMTADHGLPHPSLQIDCYATSYAGAWALAAAVATALERLTNTSVEPDVLDVILESERDWPADDELSSDERGVHRVMQEYTVWYRG